ncbi:MAG: PilZ domain-containing protein [Lachnospiraceae bacterium]|nr:PilZ domain-containing protein [Lachnospiraceae bacterium]
MKLTDLISEKKGTFVLYWYDEEDNLVSKMCEPKVINEKTVLLMSEPIKSMATHNLFCLVFEELLSDNVLIFNRGVISNIDSVKLVSDDFTVDESDKRMFYRYEMSTELMLMNREHHERVHLNNISYTGVNISTATKLKMDEEIMLYDPEELIPVYIPGRVVYDDENNNYGVMICGNFDHINRVVVPNLLENRETDEAEPQE